jgi:hypothetical protein
MAALNRRECPGLSEQPRGVFDRPTAKAVSRALEQIGIRPSQRSRRVGDYELQGVIDGSCPFSENWRCMILGK